jgi:TonB-linked SusC/RagA family outer membrane protein
MKKKLQHLLLAVGLAVLCLYPVHSLAQTIASIAAQPAQGGLQPGATVLLREALMQLKEKYNVDVMFEEKLLREVYVGTNLIQPGKKIEENLKNLLRKTGLRFKRIDAETYLILGPKAEDTPGSAKTVTRSLPVGAENLSWEQQLKSDYGRQPALAIVISGQVKNEKGEGLPGVNVSLKGTTTGTATNAEGRYSLSLPDNEANATLVFSFIGYATEVVAINNRTNIDVLMLPDIKSLSEVVVVGYGTQQRKDVTGAIASVNASDIKALPLTGVDQAMQGRVSGVQVTQNSGAPGGSVSVRIRGIGSINGSEPLYVVDGFPIQGNGYEGTNVLNTINPNDIESIEILKDAGAAAIYGSRASNGVVLITTKRGKAGNARVEIDAYYGVQSPWKKIDVLNGPEFAMLANEAFTNSNTDPRRVNERPEPLNPLWADPASLPTYDWQDAIFQNAPIQSYNLGISGGTEKVRTAITANYFQQGGLIVNSHYQRFSFRANTDYEVNAKLRFGNSLTVARENRTDVPVDRDYDGMLQTAYQMHPMQPIYAPDGEQSETVYGLNGFAHFPLTTAARYYPRQLVNPIWSTSIRNNSNFNLRLLATLFGEYEIIKGLNFRSSIGVDLGNGGSNSFTPYVTANIFGNTVRSDVSSNAGTNTAWNWINTLTFTRTLGEKHALSAVVGTDAFKSRYDNVGGSANTLPNNDIRVISAGEAKSRIAYGNRGDYALLSYIGRLTYAYDDKYLFAFNMRRDASTNFGPNNRWGTFPSASVGWRISKEGFLQGLHFLSDLKVRASWGQIGNQNIGAFRYLSTLSPQDVEYTLGTGAQNPAPAITVRNVGNADVRWETVEQTDIGLDASFLDDRVSLVADYYVKTNKDMLVDIPVPISFGAPNDRVTRNAGSIQNRGWEFAVGYRQNQGAFQWSANVNFSTQSNEVLSLGGGAPINRGLGVGGNNAGSRTEVGQPVAYFWGLQTDGIFQNEEEVQAANGSHGQVIPGDRRYVDVNGDGTINEKDRVNLGNGLPKFLYGGNFNVSFKGFDLLLFLQGQAGNKIANNNRRHLYDLRNYNGQGVQNVAREMLGRWTGPGTSNTIPRVAYFGTPGNTLFSDFYVEDGGFLRCRNIQLGYTIPAGFTGKLGVQRLRVYVSAQNLFTITKYTGYDPEVGTLRQDVLNTGFDQGRYPVARVFLGGLNLQF